MVKTIYPIKTIYAWGNRVLNVLIYALQCKYMSGNVVIPYTGDTESNSVLQFNWSMLALLTNGISEIGWRLTPSTCTVKYVLIVQ